MPTWAAFALEVDNENMNRENEGGVEKRSLPPCLPLIPDADLLEAVKCLVPVAKGDVRELNICLEDISQSLVEIGTYLRRWAWRLLGGFLNELHRRGFSLQ